MDVEDDPDARAFLDLLTSMGLKQDVNVPTHVSSHCATKMIRYRQLRAIDFDALCQDVEK